MVDRADTEPATVRSDTTVPPEPAPGLRELAAVAPSRDAGGRLADDIRAVKVVWKREMIRFGRSRTRVLTSLAQPVFYLFLLGSGLSAVVPAEAEGFDYRTFMFPGVLAMTVLFTSIFSAISIVWDREFGFLREMLVAPVRRGSIVVGKCLGGATVATLQGGIVLLLGPVVHVRYSPLLVLELLAVMLLIAIALTALGLLLAARITRMESFQVVMQFVTLPMFFISGAVYPVGDLPGWLAVLNRLNPLTYAIDPLRRLVFDDLDVPASVELRLNPGVHWNGWLVPLWLELVVVGAFGLTMFALAAHRFAKVD